MRNFLALVLGTLFGIILVKAEVLSWFRIQEMFAFQSIHMFGIIGLAVVVGALSVFIIRKMGIKSIEGNVIELKDKAPQYKSAYIGGTIFGLGWAMTGACPGPLYALIGSGTTIMILTVVMGILGVLAYAALRSKLPH
ncbi:MAG TPA: transporter [Flavobacteriales bacterium]|jgi:uncharacterized protein|nr:transporter [Flavobacteriales bacterium]